MKKIHIIRWMVLSGIAAIVLFSSCSKDRSIVEYQTHPNGFTDPNSEYFHGYAAVDRDGAECKICHGTDFRGGESDAPSCYECHSTLHNDVSIGNIASHRQLMASANWDLARCARCHGADYMGGTSGVSCTACHTDPGGPSDCRTCHGMPPVDDESVPYGMFPGAAGAHAAHQRFGCRECHAQVTDLSHTGPLPAQVTFDGAAVADANGYSPSFTHIGDPRSGNGGCNSVYCHSNGADGAPRLMPQWVGGRLDCAACHGMPPASPHPQIGTCHQCHTNVDPSSNYNNYDQIYFLNEALHVNGTVDF